MIPRLLIIDDLFGRRHADRANKERANLCAQYLLRDVTGDETDMAATRRILKPVADAVFCRGQQPACAAVGDTVENDLEGTFEVVRAGWDRRPGGAPRWALVLLDLCFYTGAVTNQSDKRTSGMPEGRQGDDDPRQYFGLRVLRRLHEQFPQLPVVILSSKSRDEVSLEFATHGALAFLPRSEGSEQESLELLREYLRTHGLLEDDSGTIVGRSLPLLLALRAARRAAADRRNLLIRGERGTGKELFARYLHQQSGPGGNAAPYAVVNTPALSPELFASELFGHVRGAFTGAFEDRAGRIVEADGGDLFLDEIANMPAAVQTGVLRVLECRQVSPVGGTSSRHVDVRFLSATNEDLEARAASGTFREDLLDRLREGGTLLLPPLRDRVEDIPALVEHFVRRAEASLPGAMTREITADALEKITAHQWPGNIRELQSCIHQAIRNHPHVEHLVAGQLPLQECPTTRAPAPAIPPVAHETASVENLGLDDLLDLIRRLDVQQWDVGDVRGRLSQLQETTSGLIAAAISTSLRATCRYSNAYPDGEIRILPAMQLLTGNDDLTAPQAADLVKRLLRADPAIEQRRAADPLLDQVWQRAHNMRPKQPRTRRPS